MKKVTAFILCFSLLGSLWAQSFALDIWELECEYASDFDQCVVANKNGTTRSIKEFVCIQSRDNSAVLDQIILDANFKYIDDEIEIYLESLANDKEIVMYEPSRIVNEITKNLAPEGYYHKQYKQLCQWGLLSERLSCTPEISNTDAALRIKDGTQETQCLALVENKLNIYMQVAYDTVKLNKNEVLLDTKQLFEQAERTKYDELLSLMLQIVWYLERLASGITHWTPHPKQS